MASAWKRKQTLPRNRRPGPGRPSPHSWASSSSGHHPRSPPAFVTAPRVPKSDPQPALGGPRPLWADARAPQLEPPSRQPPGEQGGCPSGHVKPFKQPDPWESKGTPHFADTTLWPRAVPSVPGRARRQQRGHRGQAQAPAAEGHAAAVRAGAAAERLVTGTRGGRLACRPSVRPEPHSGRRRRMQSDPQPRGAAPHSTCLGSGSPARKPRP